jgi:hypothetical protein
MARKKQNPIDDLAKNVGGWLGGAARTFADLTDSSRDNAPRTKGTQKFIEGSRMIGRAADALTGGFGSAALKDARKGSSVPSNLLKTAAVNLAAGGVAYGAAKTAGAAGRAVVAGGYVAPVVNKLTGQTVIVHGTGAKLKGPVLIPRAGSPGSPDEAVVFGWNPRAKGAKDLLPTMISEYAAKVKKFDDVPQYNVVIGKAPSRAVKQAADLPTVVKSTEPVQIRAVVKTNTDYETYIKNLTRELKKAGAPLRGDSNFGRLGDRVERIRRQRQYRRSDRNSPT